MDNPVVFASNGGFHAYAFRYELLGAVPAVVLPDAYGGGDPGGKRSGTQGTGRAFEIDGRKA